MKQTRQVTIPVVLGVRLLKEHLCTRKLTLPVNTTKQVTFAKHLKIIEGTKKRWGEAKLVGHIKCMDDAYLFQMQKQRTRDYMTTKIGITFQFLTVIHTYVPLHSCKPLL